MATPLYVAVANCESGNAHVALIKPRGDWRDAVETFLLDTYSDLIPEYEDEAANIREAGSDLDTEFSFSEWLQERPMEFGGYITVQPIWPDDILRDI